MNASAPKNIPLDKKDALLKAESYCAYQERSQHEVRQQLLGWKLRKDEAEEVISSLIENNFLNEERFSIAYTLGKFRMKGWGRLKIKQGLKIKQVSPKLIEKALKQLDGDEYFERLVSLLEKKAALLRENDLLKKRYKVFQYLLSKGYERDIISDALNTSQLFNK